MDAELLRAALRKRQGRGSEVLRRVPASTATSPEEGGGAFRVILSCLDLQLWGLCRGWCPLSLLNISASVSLFLWTELRPLSLFNRIKAVSLQSDLCLPGCLLLDSSLC